MIRKVLAAALGELTMRRKAANREFPSDPGALRPNTEPQRLAWRESPAGRAAWAVAWPVRLRGACRSAALLAFWAGFERLLGGGGAIVRRQTTGIEASGNLVA